MSKIKGYSIYGFLGGPISKGGLRYSLGMDTMRGKVRALGIEVPPSYNYTEWKDIVSDILKTDKDTKILIWAHSFGANAITWIADALKDTRKILYIAGFDPSITTIAQQPVPLGSNVEYALCIQGTGLSLPGHGRYMTLPGSTCKLTVIQDSEGHTDIDDNEGLHGRVLKSIRTLCNIGG